jgi:type II secretory pathway pseudopilin PulG
MRLVVLGCVGVLLVLGVIVLVGYVFPSERQGRAERLLKAEPEVVQGVILDVTRQPEWRAGVASVALTDLAEGKSMRETIPFWRVIDPGCKIAAKLTCMADEIAHWRSMDGLAAM